MDPTKIADDIDVYVFRYFATPPQGIHLPLAGLSGAQLKRLGPGLIAMFDADHWKHKRDHQPRTPDPVDMDRPFDASRFNFNKAESKEVILKVTLCGGLHNVLVNISPLMLGHIVVPLWAEKELPQGALDIAGIRCMFELASKSRRHDFRVAYNSLGAFASVNHLHIHGLYAAALDGDESTQCFPIEAAACRSYMSLDCGVRVSKLSLNSNAGHLVNGFVLEGPLDALIETAGHCIELLKACHVPHNVLIRMHPSPACFIIPRRPQELFEVPKIGCNAAICEICGFLVMQGLDQYRQLSLESARSAFLKGASLPENELNDLLAYFRTELAWRSSTQNHVLAMIGIGMVVIACSVLISRRVR